MSNRRGLSLEEKRKRMLDVFYEKKDVFQLKELEKIGPAEKGVVAQSVKDVVTSLVDDGYVESEKIGTSIYFWAFPSKATQIRKRKLEALEDKENAVQAKHDTAVHEAKRVKLSRDETPEREELMAKIAQLKEEQENLKKLVDQYRDSDPQIIEKEKSDIEDAIAAANRWTDNIFNFRSWAVKITGVPEATVIEQCGIPEDLDYIE